MSKKNKLFSITVLASMLAMTGCAPIANTPANSVDDQKSQVKEAIPVDVEFLNKEVLYDGNVHSIEIEGELPEGVSVTYSDNNSQVNVGSYGITAYFSDAVGTLYQSKTAVLTIKDSNISNDIWNSLKFQGNKTTFVYDGNPHSLEVDPNTIPEGFEVSRYTNNSGTNVGDYVVTVYIRNKVSKVEVYHRTTVMTIIKADIDMSQVTFESKEFSYDGQAHSLSVEGLDSDLVEVSYSNNSRIIQGSQNVTASFKSKNKNYNDPASMTAKLTITSASETVNISVRAIYNGNNTTVMGDDGTVTDTNQTGFIVSLPVGGTLTEDMLPVLAFSDGKGGYNPAPLGAYTATFKTDTVTEVKKQTTPIELEVTYTATIYSIVYAYTNSKKGSGTETISYSYDQEINLPAPSMNDGYEFAGWSYLTNYDVNKDIHYSNRADEAAKFKSGTISTAGRIPAGTCVGNLLLTVMTSEIGASSSISDQQKVYNGLAQDVDIKNKNPLYYYELSYVTAAGYATTGAPKDVGTYTATLNVYKDATKTVQVIPSQSAIFTIVEASLPTLATKADGTVGIYDKNSATDKVILNSDGSESKAIFSTSNDGDSAYDLTKNMFTYTYDGNSKEVGVKLGTTTGQVIVLRNNDINQAVPFVPYITYRNVTNGYNNTIATTTAPIDAGTYEITVTFSARNNDSSNYISLSEMKSTMIISKRNVDKEIEDAEKNALTQVQYPLWTNDEGIPYANTGTGAQYTFNYEEGKVHTVYYNISASNIFPKDIVVDHYSGNTASNSANNQTATVYFRSTNPNIETPSPRTILFSVISNSKTVTFYLSTNLNTPIATYNVNGGDASPIPTLPGDDVASLGYDTFYYIRNSYNSATQTGTDATNVLKNVTADTNEIVIVRKPHIYNIKYVVSSLADNSMNEKTYSIVDDDDKVLKAPTLSNSIFLGWYLDPNFSSSIVTLGTQYKNILPSTRYADIVLYGKFSTNTPSVYFYSDVDSIGDGGVGTGAYYAQITNTFGQAYKLPEGRPSKEGHTFKYWYILDEQGNEITINETTVVTTPVDHAVYAKWESNDYNITVQYQAMTSVNDYTWKGSTETYIIKYGQNLLDATNINTTSAYTNIKLLETKLNEDAKAMGYSFDGFYATTGEKISIDDYVFTSTSNQAITARFSAKRIKVNYYFVEFESPTTSTFNIQNVNNVQIANSVSIYSTVDQVLTMPSNEQISKNGYDMFAMGQLRFTDASLTAAVYDPQYNITGVSYLTSALRNSLVVVRNGEEQIDICIQYNVKTYTVTFIDTNGFLCDGTASNVKVGTNGKLTVKYRGYVDFPTPTLTDASYNGYEFEYWEYETSQYKGRVAYEYTRDITVKLKTKAKEVNLIYYTSTNNDQMLENLYKVAIGDKYIIPSQTPEKEGCTFVGWVTRTTYERVKRANQNVAINYQYIWKTRSNDVATLGMATKENYFTNNDFITSVTTVEQADFLDDSYALYAVYIRNEYKLSIEYTSSDANGGETTSIKKINGTYLFQVTGSDATVGKWDQYIYVEKGDGTAEPLSITNDANDINNIPERGGYQIQGLTLGNTTLFGLVTENGKSVFKLSFKSVAGDYEPGKGNISWTNPMVLTVSYSAIVITSHISTQQKQTRTVEKTVIRKVLNDDNTISEKEVTTNVVEEYYAYVDSTRSQTFGANMLLPNDPVLDGYTFKKWIRTDANGNVYYVNSGGNKYTECVVNSDSGVNSFGLYTLNADGTYSPVVNLSPNSDIYVKAIYERNPLSFTFTGQGDDGVKVNILTSAPDGTTSEEIINFFKDNPYGYQLGTSTSGATTFKYLDNFTKALTTITLPALTAIEGYSAGKWVVTVEVKDDIYSSDGLTLIRTDSSTRTVELAKLGDEILKNNTSFTNIPVTIQNEPKKVQIQYKAYDETDISSAEVNYSSSFTLPTAPEIEGKDFAGWRLQKLSFIRDQVVSKVDDTNTIINSGTITLNNFNYISIYDGIQYGEENQYFIRFIATYVDKSYKIKFNVANGDSSSYVQDQVGEYLFSIKNGQTFKEVLMGDSTTGTKSLQLLLLDKLGLNPSYYAITLRSQKTLSSSTQKEIYCFSTQYNDTEKIYEDTGTISNISNSEYYSYSTHGAEFALGIIYLAIPGQAEQNSLFNFEYDTINTVATLNSINGRADNATSLTNLWIPSYVLTGTNEESLLKVTKLKAGFLYNQGYGFNLLTNLERITIPSTITEIEENAFAMPDTGRVITTQLLKLTSINYIGSTAEWMKVNLVAPSSHPLYLVGGDSNNYYSNDNQTLKFTLSDNYSDVLSLGTDINSVSQYAFINMSYLKQINVAVTVSTFNKDCFRVYDDRDCIKEDSDESIAAVESFIPLKEDGTPMVGTRYIIRNNKVTAVNYAGGLNNWVNIEFASKYSTPMSLAAFENNDRSKLAVGKLILSSGVCESVDGAAITQIRNYTFYNVGCLNGTIVLSNSTTSIGDYAFSRTGITSLQVPTSVTSLGQGAFAYCPSLTNITIPSSITEFKAYTFLQFKTDATVEDVEETRVNFTIDYKGNTDDFNRVTKPDASRYVWFGTARCNKPSGGSVSTKIINFLIKYSNLGSAVNITSGTIDQRIDAEFVDSSKITR